MNQKRSGEFTVGLVLPYLKSRGTEKQALGLAKGFIEKGARIVLFVVQGWGNEEMYQAFTQVGVEVVNVGSAIDQDEKKVRFFRFFSLYKLAKKYDCDILFSRAGMTNKITGFAGLLDRVPTVAVFSSSINRRKGKANYLKKLISFIIFKINLGFPTHIITVSKEGADNLIFNYPSLNESVSPIQNGVDIGSIVRESQILKKDFLPKNRFNLCYSGSIEIDRKGLDILIEAVRNLVYDLKQEDILLTLIGTGDDLIKVKSLVNQNNLQNYVNFYGETNNPYNVIRQSDVFILPSRREGLPNSLLEAMALGVCCIASDCNTGPREIIEDQKNGLLVPAGSSTAISDAIMFLKMNSELRKCLAKEGAETVKISFSYNVMIDNYYHQLRKLLRQTSENRIAKSEEYET